MVSTRRRASRKLDMINLDEVANKLSAMHAQAVEHALFLSIVKRTGRTPTNADVAKYGFCEVHPEFTRYLWDGKELFVVRQKREGNFFGWEIKYA